MEKCVQRTESDIRRKLLSDSSAFSGGELKLSSVQKLSSLGVNNSNVIQEYIRDELVNNRIKGIELYIPRNFLFKGVTETNKHV